MSTQLLFSWYCSSINETKRYLDTFYLSSFENASSQLCFRICSCLSRVRQLDSGIVARFRNSHSELLSSGIEQIPSRSTLLWQQVAREVGSRRIGKKKIDLTLHRADYIYRLHCMRVNILKAVNFFGRKDKFMLHSRKRDLSDVVP